MLSKRLKTTKSTAYSSYTVVDGDDCKLLFEILKQPSSDIDMRRFGYSVKNILKTCQPFNQFSAFYISQGLLPRL